MVIKTNNGTLFTLLTINMIYGIPTYAKTLCSLTRQPSGHNEYNIHTNIFVKGFSLDIRCGCVSVGSRITHNYDGRWEKYNIKYKVHCDQWESSYICQYYLNTITNVSLRNQINARIIQSNNNYKKHSKSIFLEFQSCCLSLNLSVPLGLSK